MTKQTAAEATAEATAQAIAHAKAIIAKLEATAAQDGLHWGHQGNAAKARDDLAELARFLNA